MADQDRDPVDGQGMVVLVIEDDESVRELLDVALTMAGFDVRTAGDGLEGLLKMRLLRPAVCVLDLGMPDVDGLRVLDELYTEHSSVPVLVVTGDGGAAAIARDKLGAHGVMEKPFDPASVVTRLHELLSAGPGADQSQNGGNAS